MPVVACIIPAFNEEEFIADVIRDIPDYINHIIVVNDASTDHTEEKVRELNDPRVVLINHTINQGVGGAVISGYRQALQLEADIAVKLDGDRQMNPADIARLIQPLLSGDADYAKGVRFHNPDVKTKMPKLRLIGNMGLSFLTKLASGYWDVFDPTNGFTAIHRISLGKLDLSSVSKDYFFETDVLIKLNRVSAVVADIPIETRYGAETSHLSPLKSLVDFPPRIFKGFAKRVIFQYFIKDFTATSLFLFFGMVLFLFGSIFGAYKWITGYIAKTPTPTGTIMLAVLPVIIGFQLLLQAVVLDIGNVPRVSLQKKLRFPV